MTNDQAHQNPMTATQRIEIAIANNSRVTIERETRSFVVFRLHNESGAHGTRVHRSDKLFAALFARVAAGLPV